MENGLTNPPGEFGAASSAEGAGPDIRVDDLVAYVHRADEGGWWAEVPALPGCLTQGETLDEVVDNLNDAVQGWLSVQTPQSLRAKGVQFTVLPEADAPARLPRVRTLEFAA